ncbi:MAG: SpoIIE family protein phosphatase [Fibrobacter sp.]|nr:SpoIIE family protein phosphatase [Fibrobacter sp.]
MTLNKDRLQTYKQRIYSLLSSCKRYRDNYTTLLEKSKKTEKMLEDRSRTVTELTYKLGRIHSELDDEMETAKRIQEGLMPKELPEAVNLRATAIYIPAGKVGGDLYDIIITPRQKIAILIFDVSGHGIPAALITAMAKMLFANAIEKSDSPAEVFREVNKQLCNFIKTEQYLTAFLGVIDPVKDVMTYSRAGHVPPLVFNTQTSSVTKLDSKGFFIGHSALLNIAEYWNSEVQLAPDDKILFYTDGLTEGCSEDGKLYGAERLRDAFIRNGSYDIKTLLDKLVEDQETFRQGTPLRDDFTLLCVEIQDSTHLLTDSGFTREDEPNILLVSSMNEMENICSIILRELDKCGYGDKTIKQYKICIFEMITNAILHGNKNDPSKKAVVFYKVTPVSASMSVIDEGDGFDYNNLPDPLSPENRMKDHGRGVFLMRHYFDEVLFNTKGNRILGRKYHGGK